MSIPLLTITGLRKGPATGVDAEVWLATKRWKDREQAWRLLHSVTLLQLHSARSMSHAAYHAKEKRKPSKTNAGAVLKEVRRRVQEGLELESQKAIRAEGHAGSRGARALFLRL